MVHPKHSLKSYSKALSLSYSKVLVRFTRTDTPLNSTNRRLKAHYTQGDLNHARTLEARLYHTSTLPEPRLFISKGFVQHKLLVGFMHALRTSATILRS